MSKEETERRRMMEGNVVWIVLRIPLVVNGKITLLGVFSSEALAVAACQQPNEMIGPAVVDQLLANKPAILWPGAYYPLAEGEG